MALADQTCVPCKGGIPALQPDAIQEFLTQIPGWSVIDQHHLLRHFKFADFVSALAFVNRSGAIAEVQGHHPDLLLGWGKVIATIWTHQVDGLTESDFVLAAKMDRAYAEAA